MATATTLCLAYTFPMYRHVAAINDTTSVKLPRALVESKAFQGPKLLGLLNDFAVCPATFEFYGLTITTLRLKFVLISLVSALIPLVTRLIFF